MEGVIFGEHEMLNDPLCTHDPLRVEVSILPDAVLDQWTICTLDEASKQFHHEIKLLDEEENAIEVEVTEMNFHVLGHQLLHRLYGSIVNTGEE